MKHRRKDCWSVAKALILRAWLALAALLALAWMPAAATAQGAALSHFTSKPATGGPVITFSDGDYQFSRSETPPQRGWVRAPSPNIFRITDVYWEFDTVRTMWGRHRFDRAALGSGPLAIVTIGPRNQFRMLVNGREIYRNYAQPSDRKQAWYRPFLVPIPPDALHEGINEIAIRAESNEAVGVGKVIVGPHGPLQAFYHDLFFWRILAPTLANFAMLVLGALAFIAWLARRQESELLYLAMLTLVCFLRNHRFFGEDVLFDGGLFSAISFYSTYYAAAAATGFYVAFLKVRHRRTIVTVVFLLGLPLAAAHTYFVLSDIVIYAATALVASGMLLFGVRDLRRDRSVERVIVSLTMIIIPFLAVYDLLLFNAGRAWNSTDFYVVVFNGFVYTLVFLASFGIRALGAFSKLNTANQTLALRIAETRRELAASEAERQQLMVGRAIAGERERLMQEMHDGIGSNLITALAVAEQQQQPPETIRTLRRAIADLKITVDSLEPVEGDVVALIGNLRHRMAGDLREAGLACKWEVRPCGTLPWLDAPNALHVLRIFQETIGNVLTHAGASEMRIGCREEDRDGVTGIATYVADNGRGFDPASLISAGKGLANIRARAVSLHGQFDFTSAPGAGTTATLWLPYARTAYAKSPQGQQP